LRTIAIVNQKGGCGKTTTAINLSAELAHRSLRTLLVDLDPQGHCAAGLNVPEKSIVRGVEAVLESDLRYHDSSIDDMLWEVGSGLKLLPSTVQLTRFESADLGTDDRKDRDRRLERFLAQIEDDYDFCIVDCPPAIGWLTFNALRAADETLVPVETGYFALRGAIRQAETIASVVKKIGRPLDFFMLPTLHDETSTRSENILASLRTRFGDDVVPTVIRDHESIREATSVGQPVREFAPNSEAAADFAGLADWVQGHEQTEIALERAHRRKASIQAQTDDDPRPAVQEPPPDEIREFKPDVEPEVNSRVAELLTRIKTSSSQGTPAGLTNEVPKTDLDRAKAARRGDVPLVVEHGADVDDATMRFGANPQGKTTIFRQPVSDDIESIAVTGEFCGWSTQGMPMRCNLKDGTHELVLELAPGRHEYQLVINGSLAPDEYAQESKAILGLPSRSIVVVESAPTTSPSN
jgi:chromosome partitioning protein